MSGCENLALAYLLGQETARDPVRAAREFDNACRGGEPAACANLAFMYRNGDGIGRDEALMLAYFMKACDLGMANACRWLDEMKHQ
jgi:TPR repeat protein